MSAVFAWEPPAQPANPAPLTLPADQVDLWRAQLDQPPAVLAALAQLLNPEERARAAAFQYDILRRRFTVGRGILRTLLGRYLGVPPQTIALAYGRQGKPRLAGARAGDALPATGQPATGESGMGLEFNLAHAEALAVFAITRRRRIGVDVEWMQDLRDMAEIAERIFSRAEYTAWRSASPQDRPLAFYQAWTRKEAYIKALGDGLEHPLDTFSVALLPGEPARLLEVTGDPAAAQQWTLVSLEVAPQACGALAVEGNGFRLCGRQWSAALLER